MPGTNAGTGYPLTLRCSKCKVLRDWKNDDDKGTFLEATGRTKPLASSQRGRGNPRALYFRAEYRCQSCGHTGWSRHSTMLRLLTHAGFHFDRRGVELCGKCKKKPAEDPHKCPYAEDMDGISDADYCNCCPDCEELCHSDI